MAATVRTYAQMAVASHSSGRATVSAYQLQQFMFDRLRDSAVSPDCYELDEGELAAIADNDIAALYQRGVHPVLLNSWCRATGYTRDAYREILAPLAPLREGSGRWQNL
jgi:hypothetical protein